MAPTTARAASSGVVYSRIGDHDHRNRLGIAQSVLRGLVLAPLRAAGGPARVRPRSPFWRSAAPARKRATFPSAQALPRKSCAYVANHECDVLRLSVSPSARGDDEDADRARGRVRGVRSDVRSPAPRRCTAREAMTCSPSPAWRRRWRRRRGGEGRADAVTGFLKARSKTGRSPSPLVRGGRDDAGRALPRRRRSAILTVCRCGSALTRRAVPDARLELAAPAGLTRVHHSGGPERYVDPDADVQLGGCLPRGGPALGGGGRRETARAQCPTKLSVKLFLGYGHVRAPSRSPEFLGRSGSRAACGRAADANTTANTSANAVTGRRERRERREYEREYERERRDFERERRDYRAAAAATRRGQYGQGTRWRRPQLGQWRRRAWSKAAARLAELRPAIGARPTRAP